MTKHIKPESNNIAIFSDTHFGRSKNDEKILKYSIDYIKNTMIPDLKNRNISNIFFLGDLFDNRNLINVKVQNELYDLFSETLKNFNIYMLIGNHDIYYSNSIETHSIKSFKNFDHIHIINDYEVIEINNHKILMVSWLINTDELQDIINNNHSDIMMGHFDIVGFQYNKHTICDFGIDQNIFVNKFKYVFSGHFHKYSHKSVDNTTICYVGAPWQIDRNDTGEERGYLIYDLNDNKIERVINNITPTFINLNYPDDLNFIENNIIDLTIRYKPEEFEDNKESFNIYIEKLESLNPYKINIFYESIINESQNQNISNVKTVIFNFKDMKDSFMQYLNTKNIQDDEKNNLHNKFSIEFEKEINKG